MGKNNSHPTCGQNMEFILKTHFQTFTHNLSESKDQTKLKKATKSIEIIIRSLQKKEAKMQPRRRQDALLKQNKNKNYKNYH